MNNSTPHPEYEWIMNDLAKSGLTLDFFPVEPLNKASGVA
jgi:hypothetical protein